MNPKNSAKRFWTTITLVLSIVIGLVTNIASSSIPDWLKPYLGYAWPLLLILSLVYLLAQLRSDADSHSPSNDKDKITFAKTLEILPSQNGAISFLRRHDFGSAFEPIADLKELREFRDHCSRPEFFYLDKELERLRMELLDSFSDFDDRISAERVFLKSIFAIVSVLRP